MKKLIYLFLLISFVSFPQDFDRKKYKTARKNGNQAHKKLLNQDYYGAIALYNNVVENYYYPFQVQRAYEGRGFAKFELEDYKGAVEDFTEAIEYERAENSILFSLPYPSDIKQTELYLVNDAKDIVELYLKSSYSKYKLGDNKGACEDARKVQEFRNEFPNEIELPKLPNNYDTSDLIKSVCEEINITSKPKSNPFNTNDNNLYNPLESVSEKFKNDDYYGAISDFTKDIENNPNDTDAYINRGLLKSYLKHYKGAITDYTKAIELNPNDADVYINRGAIKVNLNDFRGALSDYTKAIEIDPNYADAYSKRGLVKVNLNDFEGALSDYTKAIEINSNDTDSYINRGAVKDKLEDYYGAISDYTKAIYIDPSYAQTYVVRGIAKDELKDYYGAILDYTKAININPNLTDAFVLRGIAKYYLGDKNGSCKDAHKLQELGYDATALIEAACN